MGIDERREIQLQGELLMDTPIFSTNRVAPLRGRLLAIAQAIEADYGVQRLQFGRAVSFRQRWEMNHGYKQNGWRTTVEALEAIDLTNPPNDENEMIAGDWILDHVEAIAEAWAIGAEQEDLDRVDEAI